MDAAERWLQAHDPEYRAQSVSWRHIRGGVYRYDQIWERNENRGRLRDFPVDSRQVTALIDKNTLSGR